MMSANSTDNSAFDQLVLSLAAAAMQHLGKTLNPITRKVEKNLTAAQATIDMLDMLEAKTRGNLTDSESRLLKGLLADLKLNYVQTLNETPPGSATPDSSGNSPPPPAG